MKQALILFCGDSALDAEGTGIMGGGVATTRFTIFMTVREQTCCRAWTLTGEL